MVDAVTEQPIAAESEVVEAPAPEVVSEQPDALDAEAFYGEPKEEGEELAPPVAEAGEGEEEQPEEASEPIAPPLTWAKDAKDVFAALPREAQEIIATRERDREVAVRAKFEEAAGTRRQVETEARTALQTIMTNHQRQLQVYAQQIEVTPPDLNLLASDNPDHRTLYFQQEAQYRHASAQREQLAQQMSEAEQHAQAIAQHQQQAELQAEHSLLEEKLGTDWSDPSSRAKLLGDLTPIAAELGYPQELIAQARACDILAMKHVADLKADADKWRAYNKAKMVPVRAAIGKTIPPTARPSAPVGQRQPPSVEEQLYPNDVRRN